MTFALLLVVAGAPSALAAAPGNDNVADATVTAALPYADDVDTTEATVEATDPSTGCFDPQNTVWYSFTPGADGFVAADTFGSDYDTTLAVFTGSPGSFDEVGCDDDTGGLQSRVIWNAEAGTTYSIMAGTCCGGGTGGGSLRFSLDNSAPPFAIESVTVNATGTVKAKTGVATVSGSIECSNGPGEVYLEVFLRQRVGRVYINGFGDTSFDCSGTQGWSMTIEGSNGLFVAGRATASVYAEWDGGFIETDPLNVKLRG